MTSQIQAKQISAPLGTTVAVQEGDQLTGAEAGELQLGVDESGQAQIIATDADGNQVVVGAGTPGTPAAGVVSVQGVAGGTVIPVTASITGTPNVAVTSATLPVGAATDASLTGGNQKAIARGGAKGATSAADVTSTACGPDHQSLDVTLYDPSGNPITSLAGTVSVNNFPVTQNVADGGGSITVDSPQLPTALVGNRLQVDGSGVIQPVSVTSVVHIDDNAGSLSVDDGGGSLTVDGSVGIVGTPNVAVTSSTLPTGAATEATLATLSGKVPASGQKTMSASLPVVIASDQSPLAVSGTITTNNPSVGTTGSALPASATELGGSDGTNLQAARVFDADSGAGTQFVLGTVLRKSAAGGSVEAGTSSDPLRVDPTGTTTQPISASTLPLPSGAATSANQATAVSSLSSIDGKLPALASGRVPVDIGSSSISGTVSVSNFPVTQPMSASALPLPTGAAKDSTLTDGTAKATARGGAKGSTTAADVTSTASGANHQALDVVIYDTAGNPITSFGGAGSGAQGAPNTTANAWPTKVTDGTNTAAVTAGSALKVDGSAATQPVSGTVTVTGVATETTLGTRLADATFITRINTQGQKTSAASTPVVLASDQSSIPVAATVSGTVAVSSTTLALDATLTGGTQKAIARGAAKGATSAADITSTAEGTDHQAIDVQVYHGGTAINPTQIRALTSADQVTIVPSGTQTVSGTVTVTGVALDATLTGGTQKAIARGAAKGATTAADITSTAEGTDHQAIDVQLYHSGTAVNPTQIRALTSSDQVTVVPSGTQTVTGTVAVTSSALAQDATLTGGTAKAITRGGAKGTTPATDVTSTASGANHQPLDVAIYDASGNQLGTSSNPLRVDTTNNTAQAVTGTINTVQSSPATLTNAWPVKITDGTNLMPTADSVARAAYQRLTDGTNGVAAIKPATTPAVAGDTALVVALISPPTATVSNVNTSTTNATLLSSDPLRRGATIANDSAAIMYIKFGVTASSTNYTVALAPAVSGVPSYYEVLQGYSGQIDAILATGTGTARVTVLK